MVSVSKEAFADCANQLSSAGLEIFQSEPCFPLKFRMQKLKPPQQLRKRWSLRPHFWCLVQYPTADSVVARSEARELVL